jgi:hypothetical protein
MSRDHSVTVAHSSLWVRLFLTPALMASVTIVSRQYGMRVGGLLLGLPLVSGPTSAFLTHDHGPAFAAAAAIGTLESCVGLAAFCGAYAMLARDRHWPRALGGGIAALSIALFLLHRVAPTLPIAVALATGALIGFRRLVAARPIAGADVRVDRGTHARRWELPVRIGASTGIVLLVSTAAPLLGPTWSGIVPALPLLAALFVTLTHAEEGSGAAIVLLIGLLEGALSAVAFFAVLGALLGPHALVWPYVLASGAAIAVNAYLGWADDMPPTLSRRRL